MKLDRVLRNGTSCSSSYTRHVLFKQLVFHYPNDTFIVSIFAIYAYYSGYKIRQETIYTASVF